MPNRATVSYISSLDLSCLSHDTPKVPKFTKFQHQRFQEGLSFIRRLVVALLRYALRGTMGRSAATSSSMRSAGRTGLALLVAQFWVPDSLAFPTRSCSLTP